VISVKTDSLGLNTDAASSPGDAGGVDGAWSDDPMGSVEDRLLVGVCGLFESDIALVWY
jgi:hypothetical protein